MAVLASLDSVLSTTTTGDTGVPSARDNSLHASLRVSPLAELDAKLASATILFVDAPKSSRDAWMAHVERRVRAGTRGGRAPTLVVPSRPTHPSWSRVATLLAINTEAEAEPRKLATSLLAATESKRAAVIVATGSSAWDRAVSAELARVMRTPSSNLRNAPIVIFADEAEMGLDADRVTLPASLTEEDVARWWTAWADDAAAHAISRDVTTLETWARGAANVSRTPLHAPRIDELRARLIGESGLRSALGTFVRLGEEATPAELRAAGIDGETIDRLMTEGALRTASGDRLRLDPAWADLAREIAEAVFPEMDLRAAEILQARPADPWTKAQAAALLLRASRADAADRLFGAAMTASVDALARKELGDRWAAEIAQVAPQQKYVLYIRSAERALSLGEADDAVRWARSASAVATAETAAAAALLQGRAAVAIGDLVAARAALRRALAEISTNDQRDGDDAGNVTAEAIGVELADVDYLSGEMDAAAQGAAMLAAHATSSAVRLRASNVLGKLLLARAQWDAADRHFANDAMMATAAGDATAEMRAQLNRGIARLSKGSLDEAAALFRRVLEEGERLGDLRACAFALDNLAVVASWRREYGEALSLSERTLDLRRRLGDRLTTARIVANLAELRRRVGAWEHAEQAVAFGRRLLGPGMPPARASHFSVVAARIALARGDTFAARRDAASAIRDGEAAGDREFLGEAHRVSARIALEEGDLTGASRALENGRTYGTTAEALAEIALLDGLLGRARGDAPDGVAVHAREATARAREAGDEELLVEAFVLLAKCADAIGDESTAEMHRAAARDVLGRVATTLPIELRATYLARRSPASLHAAAPRNPSLLPPVRAVSGAAGIEPSDSSESIEVETRDSLLPESGENGGGTIRELIGDVPSMRALASAIRKVARSRSTVLIQGESGTGKELVAEALHHASERASGPLVTVNCAALVETLLLSELFGHEKGAFTGAASRRRGRFELASGGTLFLDEIGDISPRTQVALLRVLQECTFERVGGTTPIRSDARVVCATNRDLRAMVERGEFREDLYYRLRGITLEVPALRTRLEDVPKLAEHLLRRIASERNEKPKRLSSDAMDLLVRHSWPGNVRELENALRVASLFAEGAIITAADLTANVDDLRSPMPVFTPTPSAVAVTVVAPSYSPAPSSMAASGSSGELPDDDDDVIGALPSLPIGEADATAIAYAHVRAGQLSLADVKRQIERDCIVRALAETRGNITRAAALLGMKRPRLSQLVKQYGLLSLSSTEPTS